MRKIGPSGWAYMDNHIALFPNALKYCIVSFLSTRPYPLTPQWGSYPGWLIQFLFPATRKASQLLQLPEDQPSPPTFSTKWKHGVHCFHGNSSWIETELLAVLIGVKGLLIFGLPQISGNRVPSNERWHGVSVSWHVLVYESVYWIFILIFCYVGAIGEHTCTHYSTWHVKTRGFKLASFSLWE